MPTLPIVKICCIASVEEAQLAIQAGASALGLVSAMPSGPGVITDEHIATIAQTVPPSIATVLLTARTMADAIIAHNMICKTTTIQLVDFVPHDELRKIRRALPTIKLIQVIHVTGSESILEAQAVEPFVDALLLDSGNKNAPIKELGGTGRVHDWNISRIIRESSTIPVYLAGGLNQMNIQSAIKVVAPYGIDVCSSVRTNDQLDPVKLRELFLSLK